MPNYTTPLIEVAEFMRDEGRLTPEQYKAFKRKVRRDQAVSLFAFCVVVGMFLYFFVLSSKSVAF